MPTQYHSPASMTLLTSVGSRLCAKRHIRDVDGIITTVGYDAERRWIPNCVTVADFPALARLVSNLSGRTHTCVIRGALRDGVDADAAGIPRISNDRGSLRAPFEEVARSWVAFDYDDPADFTRAGQILGSLPNYFHDVQCVVQYTSSHGLPGVRLRVRLWFLLSAPVTSVGWRRICANWSVQPDAALFRAVQPHYTAAPMFQGMDDPVPQRVVLVDGTWPVVDVSSIPEDVRLAVTPPGGVGIMAPVDFAPCNAQIRSAIERILSQRTSGSRHHHAGGVAHELRGLGCDTATALQVIGRVIRAPGGDENAGRDPAPHEIEDWWGEADLAYRNGTLATDNPPLALLFGDEPVPAPTPEQAAANAGANQAVTDDDTEFVWGEDIRANAVRYLRHYHRGTHIIHWNGVDYTFDGRCWRGLEHSTVLGMRVLRDTTLSVKKANETTAMIRSLRLFENLAPPCLLSSGIALPGHIAFTNGYLNQADVTQQHPVLRPHTDDHFILSTLRVAYDPTAVCPVFDRYLASCFPNDLDSIRLVAQMMGYLMVPDNRFQKMFALTGRPASGKSTLTRVISSILGPESMTSTQLAAASTNFGAASWIGKLACVISEANEGGAGMGDRSREVAPQLVDLLKSITGGDEVQLDRKNLPPFVGRLPLRFLLVCNNMPRLIDQSGAFMRRLVLLHFAQSFEANPDETLDVRLGAELQGIVNFALRGLRDLYTEGKFTTPDSSRAVIESCRRQTSPIRGFCEDCLQVVAGATTPNNEIYEAYRAWCRNAGRHPQNREAVIPQIADTLHCTLVRPRGAEGERLRSLLGARLTPEGVSLRAGGGF